MRALLVHMLTAFILPAACNDIVSLPITRTTVDVYFPPWSRRDVRDPAHHQIPLAHNQPAIFSDLKPRSMVQCHLLSEDEGWFMYWSMFTIPISIGTPPLNLNAIIDTSWSSLFIHSVNCTHDPSEMKLCLRHPLYDSSLSSTYVANSTPVNLLYTGPGSLYTWGRISNDNVRVGGLEIKEQEFEEMSKWRYDVITRDEYFDTSLGLSLHPSLDRENWGNFTSRSPFQNMIDQKLLDRNMFTLKLSRTDAEKGEITFGGMPNKTYMRKSTLIEIPLDHSRIDRDHRIWRLYTTGGWQVNVQRMRFSFQNGTSSTVLDIPQIAAISSSFPWIAMPERVMDHIHRMLGLNGTFDWVDCEKRHSLPDWTVVFGPGGEHITLTPWDYLIELYDDYEERMKCVSAFFGIDEENYGYEGFIVLGSPFLSGLVSLFDADRKSISFANAYSPEDA